MKTDLIKHDSPTPVTLLQQAIDKGVDMAQLEKLMELQERWEKKEARKSFFDALSRFQASVPVIKKNKTAKIQSQKGFFSYKYGDLSAITKTIQKTLTEHGLSYRWEFKEQAGSLEVTCLVSHADGHTEMTTMKAGKDSSGAKNDIQQQGSTQTYLQRYTLIGALGLSTADEDNDSNSSDAGRNNELTEEEILQQWTDLVRDVKSRIELTGLYLKNKKAVDANDKIKAIFKARENQLPETKKAAAAMP